MREIVTDRAGAKVRISRFCFAPTILRVGVGDTVTWTNADLAPHSVLGANASWGGYDSIRRDGGTTAHRFVRPGIYPYVCTYHIGMLGAVVVGDGGDTGSQGVTTAEGPVVPASFDADSGSVVERAAPTGGIAVWPAAGWLVAAAIALTAGVAVGRRRA